MKWVSKKTGLNKICGKSWWKAEFGPGCNSGQCRRGWICWRSCRTNDCRESWSNCNRAPGHGTAECSSPSFDSRCVPALWLRPHIQQKFNSLPWLFPAKRNVYRNVPQFHILYNVYALDLFLHLFVVFSANNDIFHKLFNESRNNRAM